MASSTVISAPASFRKAIEQQPKDVTGYGALSDVYVRQRDLDAATKAIDDGLRAQPGNLGLRYAAASVMILKGQHEAAIEQYESILKSQPSALLAVNNLVSLMLDHRSDSDSGT